MNDITVIDKQTGEITQFKPSEAKRNQAKLDAVIDYAKTIHDWPLLERAIAEKMEQQREFVRWWDENVQSPGRKWKKK